MVDPIKTPPPSNPQSPDSTAEFAGRDGPQIQPQTPDPATEQLEQAKQAAKLELAQQQAQAGKDKSQAYATEIVQLFETVVQEGVEGYQTPQVDQSASAFTEDHGSGFSPKEQAVLREFLREVHHLVNEQGTDLPMALRQLQTQQGGKFWQRLTQALTGGPLGSGSEGKSLGAKGENLKGGEAGSFKLGASEGQLLEGTLKNSGSAILEMMRAETNPKAHVDAMISALALLKQDGLDRSYRELVQHLRQRWGLSKEEMEQFLARYPVIYFQGPTLRSQRDVRHVPWYPLIALLSIPLAKVLGLTWIGAAATGITLAVLIFLATRAWRS